MYIIRTCQKFKSIQEQESPPPLTDPRDAVAKRMLNIPYRIVW